MTKISIPGAACRGSTAVQMLCFAVPLIFSNLLQMLFNAADLLVVGRFGSDGALGSVGSTTVLVSLFTGLLIGMGGGVNALCARYIGARNGEGLRRTVHTSFFVCLAWGILVMTLGIGLSGPVLLALKTKETLLDGALLYLRIYLCGMPALAVYNFGCGVLSASGDTGRPLAYMCISGVCNLLLNLFFVIALQLSVLGVALASIISQCLSAALVLLRLCSLKDDSALHLRRLRLHGGTVGDLLGLGLPAAVQGAVFAVANLFVQSGINRFDVATVEGNAAALNADGMIYAIMDAFYLTGATFVSHAFGAKDRRAAGEGAAVSVGLALLSALSFGVLLFFFGDVFLSLFTGEPLAIAAGMERFRVLAFSYALTAFMDGMMACSRGLGKTVVPTVLLLLGSCVFRIAWVFFVFPCFGTLSWLYAVYPVSWTISSIAQIVYFIYAFRRAFPRERSAAQAH